MTPAAFRNIYRELIDDNPLAVRAVLKILAIEFTEDVPTLAITCEAQPTLKVNLRFISQHCRSDAEVRAVIVHEFLHVLLRHTDRLTPITPADHLACDAVINAIIHRTMGPSASALMSRYYADVAGSLVLLRPETKHEREQHQHVRCGRGRRGSRYRALLTAWDGLYDGTLVADDIRDLASELMGDTTKLPQLLGNHDAAENGEGNTARASLDEALDTALQSMNGSGIFRSPHGRGVGAAAYTMRLTAHDGGVERWRRETFAVLRRHLLPDPRSARDAAPSDTMLPVLSPGDRRAALRAMWSPLLPDARWAATRPTPSGSAHVYLDASGSMNAELPLIATLLARLSGYIRRPFWAFSDVVAPARIEQGRLITDTSGGTSMRCVLDHVARHRPRAAVVVTDGFIETLSAADVAATRATRLHVVVTRGGITEPFARVGLPYTQLGKVPQ